MAHTELLYASEEGGNWRVMAADENGAYTVAEMCCDDQEAHARLFAAAPELLKALDDLELTVRFLPLGIASIKAAERARLAISRAVTPNAEVRGEE